MKGLLGKAKKALLWKPDLRFVAGIAVTAAVLLILPLLRFALYSVPWYDDYGYGQSVRNFLAVDYSLGSALQGALYCIRTQWYAWQGTYSSIFFMAMAPLAWNEKYYFLGPLSLIIVLTVSVFLLMRILLRKVLSADPACSLIVQATVTAAVVEMIHSDRAGFYWYNSGVHYVGTHSLILLTAVVWIQILYAKRKISVALLVFLSVLGGVAGGGANYVSALQGLLLGLTIFLLGGILLKTKRTLLLLPSLLAYIVGFYYNVSAPGNRVRQQFFSGSAPSSMGAISAIWHSFIEAFRYIPTFTGWRTLAVMILLAPFIWKLVKRSGFRFRFPGVVILWSVCFYATGFTPSLYAMGIAGLGRTLNAVKITWLLLLFINEVYCIGYLRRIIQEGKLSGLVKKLPERWKKQEGIPVAFYLVMALAMLFIFSLDTWQEGHYSTFSAYHYVHTGEANEFHKEYLARVDMIVNGGSVVVVPPYHFKPAPICVDDLSEDPQNEANRFMADWYGKEAIICQGE